MRLVATRKAEQNRRGLDPWTLVHLSTGLSLGLLGVSLRTALVAGVLYEAVEQVVERTERGRAFFNTTAAEVPLNALLDVAALVAGHQLGERWNAT